MDVNLWSGNWLTKDICIGGKKDIQVKDEFPVLYSIQSFTVFCLVWWVFVCFLFASVVLWDKLHYRTKRSVLVVFSDMYVQGNSLLLYLVFWSTFLLILHGFDWRFGLFCILETSKDGDSTTSLGNRVHCWVFLMGVFSAHSSSLHSCFLMTDLPSSVLTVPSFWCDLQMGKVRIPSPLPCHW